MEDLVYDPPPPSLPADEDDPGWSWRMILSRFIFPALIATIIYIFVSEPTTITTTSTAEQRAQAQQRRLERFQQQQQQQTQQPTTLEQQPTTTGYASSTNETKRSPKPSSPLPVQPDDVLENRNSSSSSKTLKVAPTPNDQPVSGVNTATAPIVQPSTDNTNSHGSANDEPPLVVTASSGMGTTPHNSDSTTCHGDNPMTSHNQKAQVPSSSPPNTESSTKLSPTATQRDNSQDLGSSPQHNHTNKEATATKPKPKTKPRNRLVQQRRLERFQKQQQQQTQQPTTLEQQQQQQQPTTTGYASSTNETKDSPKPSSPNDQPVSAVNTATAPIVQPITDNTNSHGSANDEPPLVVKASSGMGTTPHNSDSTTRHGDNPMTSHNQEAQVPSSSPPNTESSTRLSPTATQRDNSQLLGSSPQHNHNNMEATATKPKPKTKPRDRLVQVLSDITGYQVVISNNDNSSNNKNHQTTRPSPNSKNDKKKTMVALPETLLPAHTTWQDLQDRLACNNNNNHDSYTVPELWQIFAQQLLKCHNPKNSGNHRYAPTTVRDGLWWQAAEWYQKCRTIIHKRNDRPFEDNLSSTTTITTNSHPESDVLPVLVEWFQQAVIIDTILRQCQRELDNKAEYYGDDDDYDDDDLDLGLFADESYGGISEGLSAVASSNNDNNNNNNNSHRPNPNTLFQQLLKLLADDTGAVQVLTKPFVSHLIQSYDEMAPSSSSSSSSSSHSKSLAMILLQECLRKLPSPDRKDSMEWETTQRHLTAFSSLLVVSPDAVNALVETIAKPAKVITDGVQWEHQSMLRSLFSLVAFTVPRFPTSRRRRTSHRVSPYDNLLPPAFHAMVCSSVGVEYPVCLYKGQGYHAAIEKRKAIADYQATVQQAQNIMRQTRTVVALALKRIAATTAVGTTPIRKGGLLFDWLHQVLNTNEPIVDLLQSDLLSPDSAQALCASRPFLLGFTVSLLQMSSGPLSKKLESLGKDAFDFHYILKEHSTTSSAGMERIAGIIVASKERSLLHDSGDSTNQSRASVNSNAVKEDGLRFTGSTELFFLAAALLRVSLFPGFRVIEEFQNQVRNVFLAIQQIASQHPPVELGAMRRDVMDQFQKCVSVTEGWNVFVDDPDTSTLITTFCLMQLEWVALVKADNAALNRIPEWFVKLPAQWLAHVAVKTPQLLQPRQGEAAVRFATQILQVGTGSIAATSSKNTFSPPVLCELIRIAGAFVQEGVRRAWTREKRKTQGRRGRGFKDATPTEESEDFETDIIDKRTLDIYLSFDARDLGVTVFANEFVATQLCRTLMRSYMAMDAAEGIDVEREHKFEKFQVKHEVADLLLRLWLHPNGVSRTSILNDFDDVAMHEFSSSVAKTLGFQLEQACQFLLDIQDIKTAANNGNISGTFRDIPLSRRDEASIDHHAGFLSFSLSQCRLLLMILCKFSEENEIATTLGGKRPGAEGKKISGKLGTLDLANMFVNLVARVTDEDGGIHQELEMENLQAEGRSTQILARLLRNGPTDELNNKLAYFVYSRRFALVEYGMDVSLLTHQLLALAARWHLAAAFVGKNGKRTSVFLSAVAKNDLCNISQLRNVLARLVGEPEAVPGTYMENAAHILQRDGHVKFSTWKDLFGFDNGSNVKSRQRMRSAKQDRMLHSDLLRLADASDINAFLDDLEHARSAKETSVVAAKWGEASMYDLEGKILGQGTLLPDDYYTDNMEEWVVSSESFLSKSGTGSFAHAYDSLVRGRNVGGLGAGKMIVKEARKCKRLLPAPHPNTSVFVCFAEERTDLCKAVIIGASETPFSLGIFEFDILFPANYPASPPLFNFNTTGDGRTRISSNLYSDGKVCISILGTYQAFDDSQRWNPSTSSLAQVLASIQTQLLGDAEPYFSDGFNHDSVRGTPAGDQGSERFNHKIRLHTLRHAMIDHLKHPPLGFEEVTIRHFLMCRKRVLAQARRWTLEAKGTPLFKSFVKAYEELATLFTKKDFVLHKIPGQEVGQIWGSVAADESDVKALSTVDPEFLVLHQAALEGEDSKPAALSSPQSQVIGVSEDGMVIEPHSEFNPWAQGAVGVTTVQTLGLPVVADSDEEFEDIYS